MEQRRTLGRIIRADRGYPDRVKGQRRLECAGVGMAFLCAPTVVTGRHVCLMSVCV